MRQKRMHGSDIEKGLNMLGFPFRVIFSFILVMFLILVFLSLVSLGFYYKFNTPINWLGNAWSAWGGLWVVLAVIFIFFRPWWRWSYYWNDYRHRGLDEGISTNIAMHRARMRFASGEISEKEYKNIINNLKN